MPKNTSEIVNMKNTSSGLLSRLIMSLDVTEQRDRQILVVVQLAAMENLTGTEVW